MILESRDIICIILLLAGLIVIAWGISRIYGEALIITGIAGFFIIRIMNIIERIKDLTNPKKMPPPKNKK